MKLISIQKVLNLSIQKLINSLLILSLLAVFGLGQNQSVTADTDIENKAKTIYYDPDGEEVSQPSNRVVVTVETVAALEIVPDNSNLTLTTAHPDNLLTFTVNNLSNSNAPVLFKANGESLELSCSNANGVNILRAVIDVNQNGVIDAGDIDIFTNSANVSFEVSQNLGDGTSGSIQVLVEHSTSSSAGSCQISLGDADNAPTDDNILADNSANEVSTSFPTSPVNGDSEAKGSFYITFNLVGNSLNGPNGEPGAVGEDGTNNSNYSSRSAINGLGLPCGQTTTQANLVFLENQISNHGTQTENYSILYTNQLPAGFVVEFSEDALNWTASAVGQEFSLGSIGTSQTKSYFVRLTIPAGTEIGKMFPVNLSAVSSIKINGNDVQTGINKTTNRFFTGYVCATKSFRVINKTGNGGPADAVPGAIIEYTINYKNIAPASVGKGNIDMFATPFVITEDGNEAPSNWGTTTTQVVGSAIDSNGGTIVGDVAGSTRLTDTIPSLAPGETGTFTFQRLIN